MMMMMMMVMMMVMVMMIMVMVMMMMVMMMIVMVMVMMVMMMTIVMKKKLTLFSAKDGTSFFKPTSRNSQTKTQSFSISTHICSEIKLRGKFEKCGDRSRNSCSSDFD